MSTFAPGDRVHLAGLGTGSVREVRSGGRYVVEIKGRAVVTTGSQLALASGAGRKPAKTPRVGSTPEPSSRGAVPAPSIDLHGMSVDDALQALQVFINDALLAGTDEVRVIHGRSGGRIKAAVHRYIREVPTIAGARLDPRNPGVTTVRFR